MMMVMCWEGNFFDYRACFMEIGDLQEYSAKFLSWFSGYSVLSDIEHNFEVAYSIKYLSVMKLDF